MKKLLSLIAIILFFNSGYALAIDDAKVISDSESSDELLKSFNEVNQYSDGLFFQKNITPKVVNPLNDGKEQVVKAYNRIETPKSMTPVKRLRLKLKDKTYSKKQLIEKNTKEAEANSLPDNEQVILDCDNMEYFAERSELEATGNVSVRFPQNNTVMKADKFIYNQVTNKITAVGHVTIVKEDLTMEGDYLVLNLNEENAIFDNPETSIAQIHVRSKQGYMYGDNLIQEQGSIYITDHSFVNVGSFTYGPILDAMVIPAEKRSSLTENAFGEKLRIKVSDIIINSKEEHTDITVKKADIYYNEKKVGFIPALTVHTNKNRDYTVVDNPEVGTMSNLGMYLGPGFVFDTPHGSVLKVVPFLNYRAGGGEHGNIGVGGMLKFSSATNRTDISYGSTHNKLLVDGIQYLDDNLFFQYGANRYMDDWFMGRRMARLMGELVYADSILHRNFLAKKFDMTFSHRIAAGYMQEGTYADKFLGLAGEDNQGVGTFRAKYMAEVAQTLFNYAKENQNDINARFELVTEGSFAVYGTGDTQAIFRVGPRLHNQYKNWMSDIGYFISGFNDDTPMKMYDSYVYGGSNVYLRESFRLSKYLTLSWLGSFNLSYNNERYKNKNIDLVPECSFFVALGPDDVRLHIGYDVARQQSFVYMTMNLDAKGTVIDYDKMIVKNPDNFSPKKKELFERNTVENTDSTFITPVSNNTVEHAQVTDIIYDERL